MESGSNTAETANVTFGTPTIDDWKLYLRSLRDAPIEKQAISPESSEESSFELEESFRALLERKRNEMEDKQSADENKIANRGVATGGWIGEDSTFVEGDSMSKVSDTSFEEMEQMCVLLEKANRFAGAVVATDLVEKLPPKPSGSALGFGDVTQIDDIDEPSGLWEHSVLPVAEVLSPVKRMHIMRPSTIIEESSIGENGISVDNNSMESFEPAKQLITEENNTKSSVISGSEEYRTAEESFALDTFSTGNSDTRIDLGVTSQIAVVVIDSSSSEADKEPSKYEEEGTHDNEDSTLPVGHEDESFSYVLDEIPERFNDTLEETDFMMRQGMKLLAMKQQQQNRAEVDHHQETIQYKQGSSEDQMCGSNIHSTASPKPNAHHHLKPVPKTAQTLKVHTPQEKIAPRMVASASKITPFGVRSKHNTPSGPGSAGHKQTHFSSDGKYGFKNLQNTSVASSASFKKPVSRLPPLKLGRKFDHIQSPIGAYIKKTPKSLLQAKITCPQKDLIDVLHNEHGRDSEASSKENCGTTLTDRLNVKGYTSSIPGKGVVSSNRAHVLDERDCVRIPGGAKMHKLLSGSPSSVIRHEGRIRYAAGAGAGGVPGVQKKFDMTEDDSMADLSVVSSDVSVRILKDAKRY
ncbi:uncharacterized protein LOC128270575 [Anopheles cruzii]|uniref:uncharacterized protein LOC128270575 n=1 Tax=Anopheles cruzii TaxID=68878 RepID=UPI0022EC6CDC|nr:uncharacterized protein LOC128270575 [Anopheles cruzii]